jgi:plasmid stabilization system protein ParE
MIVFFSTEAETDFKNLLSYYYQQGGIDLARMIENRLLTQTANLANFPEKTRISNRMTNARELVFRGMPYIAYIRIHVEVQRIEIVNIVHTARTFP